MNKKGFWGKFFAVIGILILLVLLLIGITAYQTYTLVKIVEQEAPLIEEELRLAMQGDCIKIE